MFPVHRTVKYSTHNTITNFMIKCGMIQCHILLILAWQVA